MLFKPELAQKVLDGAKTETRRVMKPGEWLNTEPVEYEADYLTVFDANGRLKWQVGRVYAVCPGRGKAGIGHIRLLNIGIEKVSDITDADAIAEGFASRDEFLSVFKAINPKSSLNTEVWVLKFERVIKP